MENGYEKIWENKYSANILWQNYLLLFSFNSFLYNNKLPLGSHFDFKQFFLNHE